MKEVPAPSGNVFQNSLHNNQFNHLPKKNLITATMGTELTSVWKIFLEFIKISIENPEKKIY